MIMPLGKILHKYLWGRDGLYPFQISRCHNLNLIISQTSDIGNKKSHDITSGVQENHNLFIS